MTKIMILEQLNPSPEYPSMQLQLYVPGMFVQLACGLQPPLSSAHSSTSVHHRTNKHQCTMEQELADAVACAVQTLRVHSSDSSICSA